MAGGRPSPYDPQLTPPMAENLAKQGLTNEEIAEQLGVSAGTLYVWQNEYPEFAESLRKGKAPIDRRVENAFLKRAIGYTMRLKKQVLNNGEIVELEYDIHVPGDTAAATRWMNNRMPNEWRDKQPEGQGNDQQLRIVLDNQTNNPEYMANVEIHIPQKAPE